MRQWATAREPRPSDKGGRENRDQNAAPQGLTLFSRTHGSSRRHHRNLRAKSPLLSVGQMAHLRCRLSFSNLYRTIPHPDGIGGRLSPFPHSHPRHPLHLESLPLYSPVSPVHPLGHAPAPRPTKVEASSVPESERWKSKGLESVWRMEPVAGQGHLGHENLSRGELARSGQVRLSGGGAAERHHLSTG